MARTSVILVEVKGILWPETQSRWYYVARNETQLCWWKSKVCCGQKPSYVGGSQRYLWPETQSCWWKSRVFCGQKPSHVCIMWPETKLSYVGGSQRYVVARNPVMLVEVKGICGQKPSHVSGSQRHFVIRNQSRWWKSKVYYMLWPQTKPSWYPESQISIDSTLSIK